MTGSDRKKDDEFFATHDRGEEMIRFLDMVFLAGGRVDAFKRLKFMANLLSYPETEYLDYYWTREYFGDYSRAFEQDLKTLIRNKYLTWFVTQEPANGNQSNFHNTFALTEKGRDYAFPHVVEQCMGDIDYMHGIASSALAYNLMPIPMTMFLSFEKMKGAHDERLPYLGSVVSFEKHVAGSLVEQYYQWLKQKKKWNAHPLCKTRLSNRKGDVAYTFEASILPENARARYSYLKITESTLSDARKVEQVLNESDIQKVCGLLNPLTLEHIQNNPDIIKKSIEIVGDGIERIQAHSDPNCHWESVMSKTEEIYRATEEEPFRVYFFLKDDFMAIKISELTKNIVKSAGVSVFDILWHTLQPEEFFRNANPYFFARETREVWI